jgi:hypothetical protein
MRRRSRQDRHALLPIELCHQLNLQLKQNPSSMNHKDQRV